MTYSLPFSGAYTTFTVALTPSAMPCEVTWMSQDLMVPERTVLDPHRHRETRLHGPSRSSYGATAVQWNRPSPSSDLLITRNQKLTVTSLEQLSVATAQTLYV